MCNARFLQCNTPVDLVLCQSFLIFKHVVVRTRVNRGKPKSIFTKKTLANNFSLCINKGQVCYSDGGPRLCIYIVLYFNLQHPIQANALKMPIWYKTALIYGSWQSHMILKAAFLLQYTNSALFGMTVSYQNGDKYSSSFD